MRRLRKQGVAIVMAAMMMASGMQGSTGIIAPATVMAATEENVYDNNTDIKSATVDFSALNAEDWGDKKATVVFAYTNDTDRQVKSNFSVKARVRINAADYATLDKDGSYIKLQGVVKLTDAWTYTKGDTWPYLDKSAFTQGDDGSYYADVTIDFKDKDAAQLMEIDFEIVGVGFKGDITFDKVAVYNIEESKPEFEEKDPSVLASFDNESAMSSWAGETGYQYFHGGDSNATPDISYDSNEGRLKVSLNYSKNSEESWSEAKVKYTNADGVDVSNYNQVSVDFIYSGENPVGKMKFYTDGIINKDCTVDTTDAKDLGNGLHKVTVTIGFSPTETPLKDLTIGLIGVNSSFIGDVYLDNLVLSQKNESEDFVKITSQAGEGTQADISKAAANIKVTDSELDESAKALQSYLNGLKNSDQVLFGHQNDVSRSVKANASLGDVYDVTGSVSGVFGIDTLALAGSEAGGTDAASALRNSVEYSKKAAQNGAIVSLSAHMPNFTNSKIKKNDDGSYDFFNCDFSESKDLSNDSLKTILPGGENNEVYNAYLDIIADYANQLAMDKIPVMFRPLHENTGSWFWWGSTNSEESYKSLYRYTRDYLESKGVHNLLYVYSPCGPVSSEEDFMSRYPGDEYVDVLGFDYYADYTYGQDADESYFENLDSTCQVVSKIADEHNKIAGISECGVRVTREDGSSDGLLVKGNPVAKEKSGYNWYQRVNDVAKKNNMPYYLVWANFSDTNFYVPYKYDDTYGQEMINEFIDYYNDSSSIFGKGTNFYENIDELSENAMADAYDNQYGYITAPFDMDELTEDTTLSAYVKNAKKVSFVVKDTATGKAITLDGNVQDTAAQSLAATAADATGTALYTATLTKDDMEKLGKTDVATITVMADDVEISTIKNLSIGKKKDVAPANVFEDFDYYSGSNGLLEAAYTQNSAAGCSSSFKLNKDNKADGTYGGAFTYTLKTKGSEVWTGNIKSALTNKDFSKYNALQMWVKPDGQGQKLVVQVTDGSGEEFEAYLTDFVKGTEAKYVSIPFSKFKGKQGGTLNSSNITKFAIWCNSISANGATDITSTIYFDGIRAVKLTDDQLALSDKDAEYGLIVTDDAIGEPTITPADPNPTPDPTPTPTPDPTPTPAQTPISIPVQNHEKPQNKSGSDNQADKVITKKATKTSDTSNVFIWIMGCVAGAGLLTASRKKSKKDQILN